MSKAQHNGAWNVGRLLETTQAYLAAKGVESPRLTAEILLAHALNTQRISLYLDLSRSLQTHELDRYRQLVRQAGRHHPVQYLTGTAHFFSLEFTVTPAVLIPRPETETLLEQAIGAVRDRDSNQPLRILELGTGSGCVAVALACQLPNAQVWATDISRPALQVATKNANRHGVAERIHLREGDLFEALPDQEALGPFDLILSNPPYIAEAAWGALPANVRDHEPRSALLSGADGLCFHRKICRQASRFLAGAGWLMLEIALDQGQAVRNLFIDSADLANIRIITDAGGHERAVIAQKQ